MKVRIAFTLDIDAEAWMTDYGIDRSEVRQDVQEHVANAIREHLSGLGLLAEQRPVDRCRN